MPLTDFYTSSENAYRGSLPVSLTDIDEVNSGWAAVAGKANIWKQRFSTYTPKVVAEHHSSRALYGKPYTRMLDVQSLDSLIQGGFYYDNISKDLYVKCFGLTDPNTKIIKFSNLQGIEARVDGYYIHQTMQVSNAAGLKWEATIGLGERFISGDNLTNMDDFYFSCLVVDPEPTTNVPVQFTSIATDKLNRVVFPGSTRTYYINDFVDTQAQLQALNVTGYLGTQVHYVQCNNFNALGDKKIFRYEPTATIGDVKPTASNGLGTGAGNGWWIRVFGVDLEEAIHTVNDLSELVTLPTSAFSHLQLRKVLSNGKVYQYFYNVSTGSQKPIASNGSGTVGYYNGWWVEQASNAINQKSYLYNANHFGFTFKYSNNSLQVLPITTQVLNAKALTITGNSGKTEVIQGDSTTPLYTIDIASIPVLSLATPFTKASFKLVLEIKPRTGTDKVLDFTIKITQVTSFNTLGIPTIITGVINGAPTSGSFGSYMTGFSLAEGVIIDDLVISEIIESVV